ncbi:MAG: hypothetical protein ACEPOZ_02375 [Marinifilaceae bacterium]
MPSIELEEFKSNGKQITEYPHITHKIVYDRDYKKQKLLLLEMSNQSKKTTFYRGKLVNGKYFDIHELPIGIQNGIGEILLDSNFKGKINIAAKLPSRFRNSFVTQTTIEIE